MTEEEKPTSPGGDLPSDSQLDQTQRAERTPSEPRGEPPAAIPAPAITSGSTVGRFFLLNRLGAGGMGVVWAAYDPELDRKVALKFVRAEVGRANPYVLARFAREAQAMARVSHPNVIAVHDVGTSGEQVYIAEEFVRGAELSQWLSAKSRSQEEILGVFLQAARGLAAAHAAGIVHRDFKPANVLVGEDGRVRVVDFGLARSVSDGPEELPAGIPTTSQERLSSVLTRPGASLGTPFYMCPEQYAGTPSDARGDQFSFCVSLHEALYGERPFAATTFQELAAKVSRGEMEPLPKGNKVPARLRDLLLRGMRTRPEERFPSMMELIAALEKDPRSGRRQRLGIAAAALAGIGLLALFAYQVQQRRQLCHSGDAQLAAVWNSKLRAIAKAAFLNTRLPFAEQDWSEVERTLTSYGQDWAAMHTEACEATRLRGEQSDDVLDLRMSCLSQHLQELKATANLFATADKQVVEKAVRVATGLSPLAECADVDTLKLPVRPPKDAETRGKVEEVRGRIAQAKALDDSARYPEGITLAEATVTSANLTGYAPLQAEALLQLGKLQGRARKDAAAQETLENAFYTAESCRDDGVASRAALLLIDHLGRNLSHPVDGFRWARLEGALLARGNDNADDEAWLHMNLGNLLDDAARYSEALAELRQARDIWEKLDGPDDLKVSKCRSNLGLVLWHQGKYPEALAEFSHALASEEKVLGPDHPDVGDVHNNIGLILSEQGNEDGAVVELRRALTIHEKVFGPEHPEVADNHNNVGKVLMQQGKLTEALDEFRLSLAIREKALGPDSPELSGNYNNIGVVLWHQGHFDEALVQMRRALAIEEKDLGPDHPAVGDGYNNIGDVLSDEEKYEEALVEMRHALAIHEKALGPDHPRVASDHSNVGSTLNSANRPEEAMVELEKALALQAKSLGPDHPSTAMTEGNIGEVELKQHAYAGAVAHLTHATAIMEAKAPDPSTLGEFYFALAQARWGGNLDRALAIKVAGQGRDDYAKLPARQKEIAEIDAWLSAHRPGH